MFYDKQLKKQQDEYKNMLAIIGKLTLLFSESSSPYLPYRCHENIFCKYFEAENLGRKDCSADAKKGKIGIGLKTWVGNDDQKVAEFGKLKTRYDMLDGLDLCKRISEYRNERIRITMNMYGIKDMIYHIIKRLPGEMQVLEHAFDYINIDGIELIEDRGNDNNTYFTDGNHTYHFSKSKNTLCMIFDNLEFMDSFPVEIIDDPYEYLLKTNEETTNFISLKNNENKIKYDLEKQLCLRLYTIIHGEKVVSPKSGLNQWNAGGRKRHENEVYIPYPVLDRNRNTEFFPPRDTPFNLHMPDGSIISAKVCQDGGKAIMSNPNKELGEWLLRKVFELKPGVVLTYEDLERFNVDSVIFTKNDDGSYSVDFAELGTYESFYKYE